MYGSDVCRAIWKGGPEMKIERIMWLREVYLRQADRIRRKQKLRELIEQKFPHGGDRKSRSNITSFKDNGITLDQSSDEGPDEFSPEMYFD